MSGTSLDGIDVAIVEFGGGRRAVQAVPRLIGFQTTPYSQATREAILAVSNAATTTAAISRLNFALGRLYARAVLRATRRFGPVE
jgi:anhydro-N-acetylmuramic acid kinase